MVARVSLASMKLGSVLVLAWLLVTSACASSPRPVQVLNAPPQFPHKVMGMTSGQGPNLESAIQATVVTAAQQGADAVVIVGQRTAGSVVIVTARLVRFLAPPPQAPPAP